MFNTIMVLPGLLRNAPPVLARHDIIDIDNFRIGFTLRLSAHCKDPLPDCAEQRLSFFSLDRIIRAHTRQLRLRSAEFFSFAINHVEPA